MAFGAIGAAGGLGAAVLVLSATLSGRPLLTPGPAAPTMAEAPVLHSSPPSPAVLSALPGDVAVIDGATLRLAETVVRLKGVQAPARGVACRSADGAQLDCGEQAAAELARLVRARTVTCQVAGADVAGRPLVGCQAGGASLNRAVIASGWARSFGSDDSLRTAELQARNRHQGLWNGIYPEP